MTRPHTILLSLAAVAAASALVVAPVGRAVAAGTDQTAIEAPAFAKLRGISLTDAQQRLSWQDVTPDLAQDLANDLPARLGGVWIAVARGDRVQVGVTGTIDASTLAFVTREANAVGLTAGFDVVSVARTQTVLASDMDWLGDQIATVNTGATAMLAAGERTDLNALELDLPATGTLTSTQTSLVATAQRRFGGELVTTSTGQPFKDFACLSLACDPPLRGGVTIQGPKSGCTAAFTAQSPKDGSYYLLTAGHCAYLQYSNWTSQWSDHTVHVVGPDYSWYWNANDDEAALSVTDPTTWKPAGYVQVTKGPSTSEDDLYYLKAARGNVVGMRLCATGAAWGATACGTVTELNVTQTLTDPVDNITITAHHLGEATTCGIAGDSGAPMYATHNAYGILVAGKASNSMLHPDDCITAYRSILRAQQTLGLNILTTTS